MARKKNKITKKEQEKFNSKVNLNLSLIAIISSLLLFFYPTFFRILIAVILLWWGLQNLILTSLGFKKK